MVVRLMLPTTLNSRPLALSPLNERVKRPPKLPLVPVRSLIVSVHCRSCKRFAAEMLPDAKPRNCKRLVLPIRTGIWKGLLKKVDCEVSK